MAEEEYPAVEGGGSLLLAWQIRNKKVLIVGGGEVRPHHPSYLSPFNLT
jgi:precorrin-2 dehydrogenase/sirohydrochlorin ferrochelatase